ncbi:MAG TPA: hypothetical protein VMV69_00180 [Pirellulales bacterium]|nr:hypothetical protein [Pirellulales bacterium]
MPDDETNPPRLIRAIRRSRVARPLAACMASALASVAACWLLTAPPPTPYVPKAIVRETLRPNLEARARSDLEATRSALAEAQRNTDTARAALESWLEGRLAAEIVNRADERAEQDAAAEEDEEVIEPPPGQELRRELEDLQARREALLQRMTPEHPDVKALDLEIADCRRTFDRLLASPSARLAKSPDRPRLPVTRERSVVWDAAVDAQWQSLRRAAAAAASRHAELASAEDRAVAALAAARKTEVAEIAPAPAAGAVEVRAGWKNLIAVVSLGLLAALAMSGAWPAPAPAVEPGATVDSVADFEAEFGFPVVGVLSI